MRYGYGRVSSKGQALNGNSLEDQEKKLLEAGCDEIVLETYTGTTMDRPEFSKVLEKLGKGDTLIVTKLDRFARTASDGVKVIKDLLAQGVSVHVLNMGLVEDTPTGRLILNILLAFAEFERDNIVERLTDGREVAKANNPEYKEGRKEREIPELFYECLEQFEKGEMTVATACKILGIHRTQWYRWKGGVTQQSNEISKARV